MNKYVRYKVLIEFDIVQDYAGEENLKTSEDYSHDLAQVICDEVADIGSCSYDLLDHSMEVGKM